MKTTHISTGERFGELTVTKYADNPNYKQRYWCICSCGKLICAWAFNLKRGHSRSCGCKRGNSTNHTLKHGHNRTGRDDRPPTRTYKSWQSMLSRCYAPKTANYDKYGGAGITVCDRWRSSFSSFLEDMGERPEGTSLDRYPNGSGNYEPGNCRWATPQEQSQNLKSNVLYPEKVRQIRWLYDGGLSARAISDLLVLPYRTVNAAATRKTWVNI